MKKTRDNLNKDKQELIEIFKQEISVRPDVLCDVCKRRCYKMQTVCRNASKCSRYAQNYLPYDLRKKEKLELCIRCMRHLTNPNKFLCPAKAYWNNLEPGKIPEEISCLTSVELRLISRIVPFLKIIKFSGKFGQYGLKGQAVLFAHDVDEIPEQLFYHLPRSLEKSELLIVTETLENINVVREYQINTKHLYDALLWLKENNPLYGDVTIKPEVKHDITKIFHLIDKPVIDECKQYNDWRSLDVDSKILFSTFNHGDNIFGDVKARQSFGIILAALLKNQIKEINSWTRSSFDDVMLSGNNYYRKFSSIIHDGNFESIYKLIIENVKDSAEIFGYRCDYSTNLLNQKIK